ncbi:hypothetical protein GX51_06663 [Blastomyces parvus]|uniref:Uncharacterized protein n=1 Tax=Blastomyces parvus TaxID=2060905 RepID=A0A2B7WHC5_9EURO|nr:hypothetical protein GX51_06663 [Blastomyces parvus]
MSAIPPCVYPDCTTFLGKPWARIDGKLYDEAATNSRKEFEDSSRLSPSRYDDAEMYFMEFCKDYLIEHDGFPKDIGRQEIMDAFREELNAIYLLEEHLRFVAHVLKCHRLTTQGLPTPWHIFLARAQTLWKSKVRTWPGFNGYPTNEYDHLVREISKEFRLESEEIDEAHPSGH